MTGSYKVDRPPEDPRTTDELLAQALAAYEDDDAFWSCVRPLHWRGTREVFDAAKTLASSSDPRARSLAVTVLSQLGVPDRSFPVDGEGVVLDVLARESDLDVLEAIGYALGWTGGARSVPALLTLSRHENTDVRYAAVHGLYSHRDDRATARLIELTEDSEGLIRDWATFALGAFAEPDSPEIREALLRRTEDEDEDARNEALRGLALRKDVRVLDPLLRELAGDPGDLALEAARELGDPRLYPALQELALRGNLDADDLADALAACRPR